ncbi:MAG: 1-deoxy-D-xylulose-5-phosphate reductoisomerase [Spirochaetaceae bacterium]|jgi:1-deoxy-D-xylulose-5-phosphate reductoisomerase|nr:1-deoxy-D-xylulose-5-phosphate reductoisomerase [Spirochaetaceae bacterium]
MMKKRVAVLGATGSIGSSTLDIIRHAPEQFEVVLLTAYRNSAALQELAAEFPRARCVRAGIAAALKESGADLAVNGIAGAGGLDPSFAAVEAGMDLALANKETMVMAGSLIQEAAARTGSRIIPVDSEHSALFHLLLAQNRRTVAELLLTASGGPFLDYTHEQLAKVSVQDALVHPTWKMGPVITVNAATLANKGLEVIEAARFFRLPVEKIKALIHRQSTVHSLIRWTDGSLCAQLSVPSMRLPLQKALYYPDSAPDSLIPPLNFDNLTLSFEKPDHERFPLLPLAYQAERAGPLYPVAYNAANETAVEAFLQGRLPFPALAGVVAHVLAQDWQAGAAVTREAVWETDAKARSCAAQRLFTLG